MVCFLPEVRPNRLPASSYLRKADRFRVSVFIVIDKRVRARFAQTLRLLATSHALKDRGKSMTVETYHVVMESSDLQSTVISSNGNG